MSNFIAEMQILIRRNKGLQTALSDLRAENEQLKAENEDIKEFIEKTDALLHFACDRLGISIIRNQYGSSVIAVKMDKKKVDD